MTLEQYFRPVPKLGFGTRFKTALLSAPLGDVREYLIANCPGNVKAFQVVEVVSGRVKCSLPLPEGSDGWVDWATFNSLFSGCLDRVDLVGVEWR